MSSLWQMSEFEAEGQQQTVSLKDFLRFSQTGQRIDEISGGRIKQKSMLEQQVKTVGGIFCLLIDNKESLAADLAGRIRVEKPLYRRILRRIASEVIRFIEGFIFKQFSSQQGLGWTQPQRNRVFKFIAHCREAFLPQVSHIIGKIIKTVCHLERVVVTPDEINKVHNSINYQLNYAQTIYSQTHSQAPLSLRSRKSSGRQKRLRSALELKREEASDMGESEWAPPE